MAGLLDYINAGAKGLVDLTRALGTPDVTLDPSLVASAGAGSEEEARKRARLAATAGMATAAAHNAPWYSVMAARDSAGQNAAEEYLAGAARSAEALKQQRDSDERKAKLAKLLEMGGTLLDEDGKPQFSASQMDALRLLPDTEAAAIVGRSMFPVERNTDHPPIPIGYGVAYEWDPDAKKYVRKEGKGPPMSGALGGGIAGMNLPPSTWDIPAQRYLLTGTLPFRGKDNIPVLQRAQELAAASGNTAQAVAVQQQVSGATRSALTQQTKALAAVSSYERSMLAHFDNALRLANKLDKSGSPVLDRWVRAGKVALTGDPDVAAFDVAIKTAMDEYAKLLSGGAQSAAMVNEGQRIATEKFANIGSQPETLAFIRRVIAKDAEQKRAAMEDEAARLTMSLTSAAPYGQGNNLTGVPGLDVTTAPGAGPGELGQGVPQSGASTIPVLRAPRPHR